MKRIFVFVLDGFGIGASDDAAEYGDVGSNTFENIDKMCKLNIPNLTKLGIKNIDGLSFEKQNNIIGSYGKLRELSKGKDTTTGHFEMMDIISKRPMPTFPNGFPDDLIKKLEKAFGTKILANKVASGTTIIQEFGEEHIKTGFPIIYTSADSVLQIATHIDVVSEQKLYEYCQIARDIMQDEYAVGRVIARPFKGTFPNFERINEKRKDFALIPDKNNTMQRLYDVNIPVIAVGKISEIFAGRAITKSYLNHNNADAIKISLELEKEDNYGFVFVNLVDTDMLYGHRNNVEGYAKSIEQTDKFLGEFIPKMKSEDILIVTGDHGNDPTTLSTDHSREFTPFLCHGNCVKSGVNLGTIDGFNQIGLFVEDYLLNKNNSIIGEKIWKK